MKRLCIVLCSLVLLLMPLSAGAAPARDMGSMDVVVEEPLQHMLNLVASAAMIEDVTALDAQNVPKAVQETLFALFHYVEGDSSSVTLTQADCAAMYDLFFAAGSPSATADGVTLDLSRFDQMPLAGAYVHSAQLQDGGALVLQADLYTLWGYFSTPAEWVPETDLTWWAGATICLEMDETSAYGYTLRSMDITQPYLDGLSSDWQLVENGTCEYSVKLPSILGLADDTPGHTVYQTADDMAMVTILCTAAQSYDDALAAAKTQYADCVLREERDFSTFMAVGAGRAVICVASDALPYVYTVDMTFPAERQQEFTLYADLIRNSLAVWGLNNG